MTFHNIGYLLMQPEKAVQKVSKTKVRKITQNYPTPLTDEFVLAFFDLKIDGYSLLPLIILYFV